MAEYALILPPESDAGNGGAQRFFNEFLKQYHYALYNAGEYLDEMLAALTPEIAEGYRPWRQALRDLLDGTYRMARRIPLRSAQAFQDAIRIFTLESAATLLQDLCICCRMTLPVHWAATFLANMRHMETAFRMLAHRQRVPGHA